MADDLSAAAEDFRASGDRWGLATSLTHRAAAQLTLGELDDAIEALERSLALTRELGNDEGQRLWLAIVRLYAGHWDRARAELATLATEAEYVSTRRRARTALAELARREDDLAEGARQLDLVAEEQSGAPFRDAMYVIEAGQLATANGELDEAASQFLRALGLAVDIPDLPLVAAVAVEVAPNRLTRPSVTNA